MKPLTAATSVFGLLVSIQTPMCVCCRQSIIKTSASSVAAFAGGFGAKRAATSKAPKKKRSKFDLDDIVAAPPPPSAVPADAAVPPSIQLDKWGLPPPTENDIFPSLPLDTILIPASRSDHSLADIQQAVDGYIPLSLDRFDANGVEWNPLPDRLPMQLRLLHQSPPVLAIDNFLTPQECQDIVHVAWPLKEPASNEQRRRRPVQVTSQTFDLAVSRRTSTSWFCYFSQVPTLLAKMQYMLGLPLPQLEEPQIVRYAAGQEFSWHLDEVPAPQLSNGGQRLATLLVYLNTLPVAAGGGTVFRDLCDSAGKKPLCMRPVQGSALLFFPADAQGRPDDRTLHKGEVVADGFEKHIVQVWTHERAFVAVLPPDNVQEDASDGMTRVAQELGYI